MAQYEEVSGWQKLKNTMKDLTWKERIEHLWEYYKWVAIAAVIVIVATVSVVISVTQNSKELLYGGVSINLSVSEEGNTYLTDGWFAKLEGNKSKNRLEFTVMALDMSVDAVADVEMASSEKLIAMVTTAELDYLLLDASSINYCADTGVLGPLESTLSQQMLAKFEGKIVTLKTEEREFMAAIDISDLPFIKKHVASKDKVYIAFPGNTPRSDINEAFLQYLMDWTE